MGLRARPGAAAMELLMAVTKDEVLKSLENVRAPDGRPLAKSGTLSDIIISDGKVFFSITVGADVVKSWEPVCRSGSRCARRRKPRCARFRV